MLRITAELNGIKVSVEYPEGESITELLDAFKGVALGLTFDQVTWDNGIIDMAEEIRDNKESEWD